MNMNVIYLLLNISEYQYSVRSNVINYRSLILFIQIIQFLIYNI